MKTKYDTMQRKTILCSSREVYENKFTTSCNLKSFYLVYIIMRWRATDENRNFSS